MKYENVNMLRDKWTSKAEQYEILTWEFLEFVLIRRNPKLNLKNSMNIHFKEAIKVLIIRLSKYS